MEKTNRKVKIYKNMNVLELKGRVTLAVFAGTKDGVDGIFQCFSALCSRQSLECTWGRGCGKWGCVTLRI